MSNEPNKEDEALHRSLQEWRLNSALPPRFQEEVWKRIEREEGVTDATLWQLFCAAIDRLAAHRRLAFSYLALTLVAGLLLGFWHARDHVSSVDASMQQRYVQSVDPYLKMHL